MQTFIDFLSFKYFISLDVLIVIYYLGAVGVPFGAWLFTLWVKGKINASTKDALVQGKYKTYLTFFFIIMFVFLEIFWRVMFEMLIAYFQMRDVLVGI